MARGGARKGAGRKPKIPKIESTGDGKTTQEEAIAELYKCSQSPLYFAVKYVKIYDKVQKAWIPFDMWPAQREVIQTLAGEDNKEIIVLKARQLGVTWLCLAYALWCMLFDPIANVLLFSYRETEAVVLLHERLKGMYKRLPKWMQCKSILTADKRVWIMSNESQARAFTTSSGDSYAATFVLVDEADLVPNLSELLGRLQPTIDGGGRMVLISRADKSQPNSAFKRVFKSATRGLNNYTPVFLPWYAHPGRTAKWYAKQKANCLANTGALDDIHQQYPASIAEALMPETLNKRFPGHWLTSCYHPMDPTVPRDLPPHLAALAVSARVGGKGAALRIYRTPDPDKRYRVGVDPAEGIPGADDTGLCVVEAITGTAVAHLAGKYEPKEEAPMLTAALSKYYNKAGILCERNNHGHAVLAKLLAGWGDAYGGEYKPEGYGKVLCGLDGKHGWHTHQTSKVDAFNDLAETLKDFAQTAENVTVGPENALLFDLFVYTQVASIDRATLSHPAKKKGQTAVDDECDAFVLANRARSMNDSPTSYYFGWG